MIIAINEKRQLSELLAAGHSQFGRVAARRPYRDEESEGEGVPGLTVETHPLLADVPVGAASDLTCVVAENSEAQDEALERLDELTLTLRNQPALQHNYTYHPRHIPSTKPAPF